MPNVSSRISHFDNGVVNLLVSQFRNFDNAFRGRVQLHLARRRAAAAADLKSHPLVTAYVPTHNRVDLLMDRALPSILKQSYENMEVLVVADRCTDDTARAVLSLRDPRLHLLELDGYVPNYPPTPQNIWFCGPVTAANLALKRARGEWIARIDDDDIWFDHHLSESLEFASKEGFEFVSSSYLAEKRGERFVCRGEEWNGVRIGGTQTWVYRSYLTLFRYSNHCWRKTSERVNDLDLQVRMLRAGVHMGYLERVNAMVLPRPGSDTIGLSQYLADEESVRYWFHGDAPTSENEG